MAYNPNQPYEQWQQQQPLDPNQQQLQIIDPQSTTSVPASNPAAGGGGNYQQSQQSYSWTDGNIHGQHHQSQQSWSWQGQVQVQGQITSPIALQSPLPVFPPLLQDQSSHHILHQQMQQNAASHFQQVADMHRNLSTFAMGSMAPMMLQAQQQPQIAYQQVASPPPPMHVQSTAQQSFFPPQQQQAQIEYQSMVSPAQQVQYQNQPMPQSSYFPQQQAQITYTPMSPTPPVAQQIQYHEIVRQEGVPEPPPQQQHRIQELLPPAASTRAVQPQEYDQRRIYQQQPAAQLYAVSQFPQVQNTSPLVLQSPSEAPTQRMLQSPPNGQSSQTAPPVSSRPHDHRLMNLERQRKTDVENTNRAGAEIHKRLQDLEQSKTQAQQDHDAKDREVRRLQEQLVSVERQRRQDAERNSQQLANLVRSQATSPAVASTGAFDMAALQKVVRETQAHTLTAQDIERVIEEQVSKRLAGMATKQDIQDAGAQMQGALSKVPASLSQQEVQQAVNRELNNVMQDVENRVNQQRRVGRQGPPDPRTRQASQDRVQTEFIVEELSDDAVATRSHRARHHDSRMQNQLPSAEMNGRTAAAGPSTTKQRTLSSATTLAVRSNQSSVPSHVPAISQRSTAPMPVQAQITAPSAAAGPVPTGVVAENALVASKRPSPVLNVSPQPRALEVPPAAPGVSENSLARTERPIPRANMTLSEISPPQNTQRIEVPATHAQFSPVANVAPQGPRLRALEASPAAHGVSENALARVERSVPRATLSSRNVSPPQNRQMIEVPAPQRQVVARLTATRQTILQQPSRPQQIEPAPRQQRQLGAPPAQSNAFAGTGQELVLQGKEVARKTPNKR
jgi:hypothetical protein